jgi:hypothetical protein
MFHPSLELSSVMVIGGPVTAPTAPGRTVATSLTFVCSPLTAKPARKVCWSFAM